jgi:hypothetical protein
VQRAITVVTFLFILIAILVALIPFGSDSTSQSEIEPFPEPGYDPGHLVAASVTHHAAGRDGAMEFSDLGEAIEFLVEDGSEDNPRGLYRRRQAAVSLARFAHFSTATVAGIQPEPWREALVELIGETPTLSIAEQVFEEFTGDEPISLEQQQSQAMTAQEEVNSMTPAVMFANGCLPLGFTTQASVDPDSKILSVKKVFRVNRPLKDVAQTFEPQRWAQCSPFFKYSYITKKDSEGYVEFKNQCEAKKDSDTSDEPVDGAYNDIFYEYFDAALGNAIYFQNLLLVNTEPGFNRYRVDYALHKSLCSRVLGEGGPQEGGIEINWGDIQVADITNADPVFPTQIVIVKRLRLGPRSCTGGGSCMSLPDVRAWTKTMIEVGMDEAGFQACCVVSN